MRSKRYEFKELSAGVFQFWFNGSLAFSFSRDSFREKFELYASNQRLSSNWIGSMLTLFHKQFPFDPPSSLQKPLDRYSDVQLVDYLRSKGLRVVRTLPVSDVEIIKRLEAFGYEVEGLVGGAYYSTKMLVKV